MEQTTNNMMTTQADIDTDISSDNGMTYTEELTVRIYRTASKINAVLTPFTSLIGAIVSIYTLREILKLGGK